MNLEVIYLKKADKFFSKNNILKKSDATKLVTKACKKIFFKEDINIDLKKLKGNLSSFYRIRYKDIRILFEVKNDEIIIQAIVNDIDFRGSIY